jgi:hypothetical protein
MRKKFHLSEGDYLKAEATGAGILLKSVTVVERPSPGTASRKLQATLRSESQGLRRPEKNKRKRSLGL